MNSSGETIRDAPDLLFEPFGFLQIPRGNSLDSEGMMVHGRYSIWINDVSDSIRMGAGEVKEAQQHREERLIGREGVCAAARFI